MGERMLNPIHTQVLIIKGHCLVMDDQGTHKMHKTCENFFSNMFAWDFKCWVAGLIFRQIYR